MLMVSCLEIRCICPSTRQGCQVRRNDGGGRPKLRIWTICGGAKATRDSMRGCPGRFHKGRDFWFRRPRRAFTRKRDGQDLFCY